ncbi:hypothetical protein ACFE04_011440 [Oxalis oulophora]
MFLVDVGLFIPRICMQDELTGVKINRATRFENKVGSLDVVAGESLIKEQILERFFIDVVAGESLIKERAAARFKDLVGSLDVVAGEPLLLPRRFRQNRAWMELNKRTNTKVKGFIIERIKGGYSVAIAGFITFLPFRPRKRSIKSNNRFTIESINPKRTNIVDISLCSGNEDLGAQEATPPSETAPAGPSSTQPAESVPPTDPQAVNAVVDGTEDPIETVRKLDRIFSRRRALESEQLNRAYYSVEGKEPKSTPFLSHIGKIFLMIDLVESTIHRCKRLSGKEIDRGIWSMKKGDRTRKSFLARKDYHFHMSRVFDLKGRALLPGSKIPLESALSYVSFTFSSGGEQGGRFLLLTRRHELVRRLMGLSLASLVFSHTIKAILWDVERKYPKLPLNQLLLALQVATELRDLEVILALTLKKKDLAELANEIPGSRRCL